MNSKRLHSHGARSEGDKLLCLDNLFHDIIDGNCLVYSFGIAEDWTFELSMADMGCKVIPMQHFQCISMYRLISYRKTNMFDLLVFVYRYVHLIQQSMSRMALSYLMAGRGIYFFTNGQYLVLQQMI